MHRIHEVKILCAISGIEQTKWFAHSPFSELLSRIEIADPEGISRGNRVTIYTHLVNDTDSFIQDNNIICSDC
jgi:hypothetical protein